MAAYAGDFNLINAYKQGKDLYATIASIAFHNTYWDNMEHFEDGTPNPEGKKRRTKMKSLVLGILYGMGNARMAENMDCSLEEAQSIIDSFFKGFPKVKDWIEKTERDACKNGYVEDFWGRKRRLLDLLLPAYSFSDDYLNSFNPLIGSSGKNASQYYKGQSYIQRLNSAKIKAEKNKIIEEALKDNIKINDNNGFIARAKRQCVNARIQGGAATVSKKAMIAVHNDKEINNLGFKLLIAVHDELIGECPRCNAEKVAERLSYLMRSCIPEIKVPFKCDATIESHWYEEDYSVEVKNKYNKLLEEVKDKEKAFNILKEIYSESTENSLKKYIN